MGNQNLIEINGKKYDAATGKLVAHHTKTTKAQPTVIHPSKNKGVVDGFVKSPKKATHKKRSPAQHAQKTQQKSQTLMRTAVKKPAKVSAPAKQQPAPSLKKKLGTSPRRVRHAQEVKQSSAIRKFEHPSSRSSVVKKHTDLKVKAAPSATHTHKAHGSQATHKTTKAHAPAAKTAHKPTQKKTTAHTATQTQGRSKAAEKLIEAALTNAQSHTEPAHKPKKRSRLARKLGISTKTAATSSAVLAGVLLGGFFAVQNVPNLAMRVAATRAGFDATMPGYQPSGFSFRGPINYNAGQVTVSFKSNTDAREYNFVQRSSNWNSDALLANFIVAENKQYQTYLDKGRTLYIYNGSNATWVDNGIWYQVEGDSDMTTDQLIRIASSI